MCMGFEVTPADVEIVLRQHWAKLDAKGLPFDVLAEQIYAGLDGARIEAVALAAAASEDIEADVDSQTKAAHAEIMAILVEAGYLPGCCVECGVPLAGRNSWNGMCYDCALDEGLVDTHVPGERQPGTLPDSRNMTKYLIAECWGHIFAGFGEMQVRFVFDRQAEVIVDMEIKRNGWKSVTRIQLEDVQDSLLNANPDALTSPADFGLTESNELPVWASPDLVTMSPHRHRA